jgi:hypothetical protein
LAALDVLTGPTMETVVPIVGAAEAGGAIPSSPALMTPVAIVRTSQRPASAVIASPSSTTLRDLAR